MHQRGLQAAAALPADAAAATPTEATPEVQATEAATTEVDSFTKLDPNTLPPEVRPYYDSLQADYTRKQQEAAPFRKLATETGLDIDGLRNGAELYNALQDPSQLVQFHTDLTAALEAEGLTRHEAQVAATQHVESALAGEVESLDPEERRIAELESRLSAFEQSNATQREAQEQAARDQAFFAEQSRQEMFIKEQYPSWKQEDFDMALKQSAYHGGNLIDAAAELDAYVGGRLATILNAKSAVAADPAHAPFPSAVPGLSRGVDFGADLDASHKAAMALVKKLPQ